MFVQLRWAIVIIMISVTSQVTATTLLKLDTVYGPLVIEDPLIAELIQSTPFQRLKAINQYGVVNYLVPTESYSRYDHSVGVYLILKQIGASREEQVAGLLHDISHTVFSHVGDYVFQDQYPASSYQDDIHIWYLKESGIEAILKKYNLTAEQVNHKNPEFVALDQKLPALCADRIEYNLQGGLLRGLITQEEFEACYKDLQFKNGHWKMSNPIWAAKLGMCSLIMTETLWGASWEVLAYRWAAEALRRSFEIQLLSFYEFHFSTDDAVWKKLSESEDPIISDRMWKMRHVMELYQLVPPGEEDLLIKTKFRGVNPIIATPEGDLPLTSLDPVYALEYERVRALMKEGWHIRLLFIHK